MKTVLAGRDSRIRVPLPTSRRIGEPAGGTSLAPAAADAAGGAGAGIGTAGPGVAGTVPPGRLSGELAGGPTRNGSSAVAAPPIRPKLTAIIAGRLRITIPFLQVRLRLTASFLFGLPR